MQKFNFDYDLENDDLFIYLEGKKSAGAIELGNFVLDFDKIGNLVAIEILNASEVFKKILTKITKISKLRKVEADMINFRNMEAIKFRIYTDSEEETVNILIPNIKEESPVLKY